MAVISDYNNLSTAIKQWCARSDSTFSNQIEAFVGFAELRMNNGQGEVNGPLQCDALNAPEMEVVATLPVVAGVATMPADGASVRTITRDGDMVGMTYLNPRQFHVRTQSPANDIVPTYYTIVAGLIRFDAAYTGNVNLSYMKQFPALSPTNLTNTILTKYPLLYLSGCLFEAFSFCQEPDLAIAHFTRYKAQVAGINDSANSVRFAGPLQIRSRRPMP